MAIGGGPYSSAGYPGQMAAPGMQQRAGLQGVGAQQPDPGALPGAALAGDQRAALDQLFRRLGEAHRMAADELYAKGAQADATQLARSQAMMMAVKGEIHRLSGKGGSPATPRGVSDFRGAPPQPRAAAGGIPGGSQSRGPSYTPSSRFRQ